MTEIAAGVPTLSVQELLLVYGSECDSVGG